MSPIDIYWQEQHEEDLPLNSDWLSPNESARLGGMRSPKRRADWLLGRWTAKLAVAGYLGMYPDRETLRAIEIRPAESGAPVVFIADDPAKLCISISHRDGLAMSTVAPPNTELGCDLEVIEEHSETFVHDYFTEEEQHAVDSVSKEQRCLTVALIWAAKESALKAMRVGLRADTRSVSVCFAEDVPTTVIWRNLQLHGKDGRNFYGWWRQSHKFVRTIVATSMLSPPKRLAESPPHMYSRKLL